MEATTKERFRIAEIEGFEKFLASPTTQLILTLVPPANPPEALTTLLQDSFKAGFNEGASAVALDIADAVLTRKGKPAE